MNELEDAAEAPSGNAPDPFLTVGHARDWLEAQGWRPRHGGGYYRGPTGYAIMYSRSLGQVTVEIQRT